MWKGATVAESTIHFRHLTGGTEENHKNISHNGRSPGRDLNPRTTEYEAEVLTTRLRRTVTLTVREKKRTPRR